MGRVYEYIDEKILSSFRPRTLLGHALRAVGAAMWALKILPSNLATKLPSKV
jgi:hypothetical protein